MSKHTPGPWMADGAEVWGTHAIRFNLTIGFTPMIAAVCKHVDAERAFPYEANARLIAASPDLYAVLKELQESAAYWSEYDVPLGIVDRINQAIAKAEGTK